jgi:hypothetical protein
MRAVFWIFLTFVGLAPAAQATDEDDIRKVLVAFNDLTQRPHVLTPDADLTPLRHFAGQEVSQVYFEVRSIRLLPPDVAFVDATASQYGSTIMKRSMPAYFVLRKVAGEWRVAVMRVPHPIP